MRKRQIVVSLSLAVLFLNATQLWGVSGPPWPSFRHDYSHSARSDYSGASTPTAGWTLSLGAATASSPAVVTGSVYAAGGGQLVCTDREGNTTWSYACGNTGTSSPAVGSDGTVYIGSSAGYLYALTPTGTLKWRKSLGSAVDASPTVGADDCVYIGTRGGKLFAFRRDGSQKYAYTAGGAIASSAAVTSDGIAYFGCDNGKVYALSSTGVLKWVFTCSPITAVKSSPSIGSDGSVYFGTMGGAVYSISSAGKIQWRLLASGAIFSSPAIDAEGCIYFGARDSNLYCVSKTGAVKWKFKAGGYIDSSPAIDADGRIFFGSNDGCVYAVNGDGTLYWKLALSGAIASSPAIGELDTLFVITAEGSLRSIGIGAVPPVMPVIEDDGDYSSWPSALSARWSSVDLYSQITGYAYAIGTTPGAEDVVEFTDAGLATGITRNDLPLQNGVTYYFSVKATNAHGLVSETGSSNGIKVDFTPPSLPMIIDDGKYTTVPGAVHFAFGSDDAESGINRYEYSLGTLAGLTDIYGWASAGLLQEMTVGGLVLAHNSTCFVNIRAYNNSGLFSAVSSDGITVDLTNPTVSSVRGGSTGSVINVTVSASDPESGIGQLQYVLLNSPVIPASPIWQPADVGSDIRISGPFDWNKDYYVAVRVMNKAGRWSDTKVSERVVLDTTPPSEPVVQDDGEYTAASGYLHATWTSTDNESGIAEYRYCIGTSEGADDIVSWTSNGLASEVTATGLALEYNHTYYFSVIAKNSAGLESAIGTSDGIVRGDGISSWPKFRGNAQNSGFSAVNGPSSARAVWKLQTMGYVESSAAIGPNGTIYVGSSDGKLYCLTSTGSVIWTYQTGGSIDSSPAIGREGRIYFGSSDGGLYCLEGNGVLKWRYGTSGMIWSSPNIGKDGTVYFGCQDGYLYALGSDGNLKWRYLTGGELWSSPALAKDGTIYIGCGDGKLYAINSNGSLAWTYPTASAIDSSPAVDANGVIYFGSGDTCAYALTPDGKKKWQANLNDMVDACPAIGPDGTIYFGTGVIGSRGSIHAFNSDGTHKWHLLMPGAVKSSPCVGANGNLYFGCGDGKIYAVSSAGRLLWLLSTGQSVLASPSLGADGSLIVGNDEGVIYSIKNLN